MTNARVQEKRKESSLPSLVIPASILAGSALFAFAADQCSKYLALTQLESHSRTQFLPPLLNLFLTTNTGAAFSMGTGSPLVLILASTATLLLIFWAIKICRSAKPDRLHLLGLGLTIGAGLGNICDRLCRGQVTDFLEFAFIKFPIFNIADVLIDLGIAIIIWRSLSKSEKI